MNSNFDIDTFSVCCVSFPEDIFFLISTWNFLMFQVGIENYANFFIEFSFYVFLITKLLTEFYFYFVTSHASFYFPLVVCLFNLDIQLRLNNNVLETFWE